MNFLLIENGDFLLLETGDKIILDEDFVKEIDEISSEIHGKQAQNNEIDSQISGNEALNTEIDSEVHGKQTQNIEINSETPADIWNTEIDSQVHGKQLQTAEIYSEITGIKSVLVGVDYRILVKDSSGNLVGEFDKFRNLKFGKKLNNYGTCSFDIPAGDDKNSSLVSLRIYTVWVYVDGTLVWAGEQAFRGGVLDEKGNNWSTIHCFTWLEQLRHRYTGAERAFTDTDAGQIAWTLIDETQNDGSYGDFGITQGTIEATIDRDRTYYNQNILEAITNLSDVLSGFDFEITDNRVFNVYGAMGENKISSIRLEYGHNVKSAKIEEDFIVPVNRAIVLGQAVGATTLTRVVRNDTDLQVLYKLRESRLSETDVSSTATLQDKGDAAIRKYGTALLKVDMELASNAPRVDEFDVGDALTLVIKSGIYNIEEQYRVFEWQMSLDKQNKEHLSLLLGKFTLASLPIS